MMALVSRFPCGSVGQQYSIDIVGEILRALQCRRQTVVFNKTIITQRTIDIDTGQRTDHVDTSLTVSADEKLVVGGHVHGYAVRMRSPRTAFDFLSGDRVCGKTRM